MTADRRSDPTRGFGDGGVPDGAAVERHRDFPYYDGRPVRIPGRQWWLVVAAVTVGFAFDVALPVPGPQWVGMWVRAVLFAGIPLFVLAKVTPEHWTAIFRRVRPRDVGLMVLFFVLNQIVTTLVAFPFAESIGATANPAGDILGDATLVGRVMFYLASIPQLLGEEVFTILPFLALMYWLHTSSNLPRWATIAIPWVITAVIFGAIHLPTYDWNVLQAIGFIGVARVMLTLAYVATKNLWVSTGAHVLNDWWIFLAFALG